MKMFPNRKLRASFLLLIISGSAIALPVVAPPRQVSALVSRDDTISSSSKVNVPSSVKFASRDADDQDTVSGDNPLDKCPQAKDGAPLPREDDNQQPSNSQPKPRSLLGFLRLWSRRAKTSHITHEKRMSGYPYGLGNGTPGSLSQESTDVPPSDSSSSDGSSPDGTFSPQNSHSTPATSRRPSLAGSDHSGTAVGSDEQSDGESDVDSGYVADESDDDDSQGPPNHGDGRPPRPPGFSSRVETGKSNYPKGS